MNEFDECYRFMLECGYDVQRAFDGAYEQTYYNDHGKLPDSHYVIERVEVVNEQNIFIHSDPTGRDYI